MSNKTRKLNTLQVQNGIRSFAFKLCQAEQAQIPTALVFGFYNLDSVSQIIV